MHVKLPIPDVSATSVQKCGHVERLWPSRRRVAYASEGGRLDSLRRDDRPAPRVESKLSLGASKAGRAVGSTMTTVVIDPKPQCGRFKFRGLCCYRVEGHGVVTPAT
ncbi:hypothetical protein EVAR_68990_1 [Eumeta japonica]|uniref:Uncharacterized protein n=1 Tax=Eumeta variegata TaxID=151549 RepID=A0A4C1ZXY6_EUMVA|nr:hypothetical protein EVAR_68990_1 [Eumeta japonica]